MTVPYYQLLSARTWAIIWCSSPFDNMFSLNFSKMSVFSASPQYFSLAHDGEIFQVPYFIFSLWLLYTYGLLFYAFHICPCLPESFFLMYFLGVKDLCFIIVSLLLPVLPQLSCYFHHFKVILLLLVHFCFGFPCFVVWWLCLATYSAACLLDSFPWILVSPSTYVYACLLNQKVLFIFSAALIT